MQQSASRLTTLKMTLAAETIAVLVGDGVSVGLPDGQPSHSDVRRLVGADIAPRRSCFDAADAYETRHGRHRLIEAMNELRDQAGPGHRSLIEGLSSLGVTDFVDVGVTGAVHGRLKLQTPAALRVHLNSDRGYGEAESPIVYCPFGSLDAPGDVILTKSDLMEWSVGSQGIFTDIYSLVSRRHLLAVLAADELEKFEEVHRVILRGDVAGMRTPFLVVIGSDPSELAVWSHRGYQTLSVDGFAEVRDLIVPVLPSERGHSCSDDVPHPRQPYMFLDFFKEADCDLFFGRDSETADFERLISAQRVTLVLGASGVGKTSLLNAGIAPLLRQAGARVACVRVFEAPALELKLSALAASESAATREDVESMPLASALVFLASADSPLVLIVDQFEEFFTHLGKGEREEFASQLAEAIRRRPPGVRFVFVMRDDFLHRLLRYEPDLSALIEGRCVLHKFDRGHARIAIIKPAQEFGWQMPEDVADAIVEDLIKDGIDPAQLQIVCTSLYQRYGAAGGVTLSDYDSAGGAAGLLRDYLDTILGGLSVREEDARRVLKVLVTISKTKSVVSVAEVAAELPLGSNEDSEVDLSELLSNLVAKRVIRPVHSEGTEPLFELAHDLLAERVYDWLSDDELADKFTKHLLRTAVSDWRLQGAVPELGQWQRIRQITDTALHTVDDVLFAVIAALHHDEPEPVVADLVNHASAVSDVWASQVLGHWERMSLTAKHGVLRLAEHLELVNDDAVLRLAASSPSESLRRASARAYRVRQGHARYVRTAAEWVLIPEGRCVIGTDHPEFDSSGPPHDVYISEFCVQKYPVTYADYAVFLAETGRVAPSGWVGSVPDVRREDCPVVNVSWHDAAAYCDWFQEVSGLATRLPTEAEWEKAATWHIETNEKTLWSWGNEFDVARANGRESGIHKLTPIGYFSPFGDSPYGVVEMCGNTFDWISDWWAPEYGVVETRDPTGPVDGTHRVARGGSWAGSSIDNSGCSHGYHLVPSKRNEYVGFRMAHSA
jgi:formylglycine-generating enzyme required for sulfatase activity